MTAKQLDYILRTIELQRADPGLGLLQYRNLLTAGRYEALFALAQKHLMPGHRVLDWGCGNGHFAYFLADFGLRPNLFRSTIRRPCSVDFGATGTSSPKGKRAIRSACPIPTAISTGSSRSASWSTSANSGGARKRA